MLKKYLQFNLLFFFFNLIIWNLIRSNFEVSRSVLFLVLFTIFSFILIKKFGLYVIITSLPLQILYLITVILFIDRSITVQLFMEYYNSPKEVDLQYILQNSKFTSINILEKRIDEHLLSNILIFQDNKLKLSNFGKIVSNIYYYLGQIYK